MFEGIRRFIGKHSEKDTNYELNRATMPIGQEDDLALTDADLDRLRKVSPEKWTENDAQRSRRR